MSLPPLLRSTRPAFLVLAPACVWLGTASALASGAQPGVLPVLVVLVAGLAAHISVNTLNEYQDFVSGLDLATVRTPFSGGSGALPAHPARAPAVRRIGLLSLAVAVAAGLWLATWRSWQLLPLGLAGVLLILTYTRWLNRSPWLCLVAPGLGFGVLMAAGTHLALAGRASPTAWLLSLVPFFLVNNLLLLNQYPDIEPDRAAGRRHLPIVYGVGAGNAVYAGFALAAYALVVYLVWSARVPPLALLALFMLPASLFALWGMLRHGRHVAAHPQHLAANVAAAVLVPLLLGLGVLYG